MRLRLRLMALFSLSVLAALAAASFLAWQETREEIYEILDAQQIAFLRHLVTSDVSALLKRGSGGDDGAEDEKGIAAFAIYDADGRLLLNNGLYGLISPELSGGDGEIRVNTQSRWRAFWQRTPPDKDGRRYIVVVGQHLDYRDEAAADAVEAQLMPWLFLFPLLLGTVLWMLNREFRPIAKLSQDLAGRRPDDETPIGDERLPSEIRPLVDKLNLLFLRVGNMLRRERRFTADAAHELRSPLAGLRVQAEVAQLAGDDAAVRDRALANLTQGIDRTARLVEQLLTLSRLDGLSERGEAAIGGESPESIDVRRLLLDLLPDVQDRATSAGIELRFQECGTVTIQGSRTLLEILVRNLLDNALKYANPGGLVEVTLSDDGLRIADDGPGVAPEDLVKLGERFFRVPGQKKAGTGLGLSIVRRVADLHNLCLEFRSLPEGGFCATLYCQRPEAILATEQG